tara:strand:+ start:400 stop:1347 length:948 start_codon:yes stop_codon:yes gene_type:complete
MNKDSGPTGLLITVDAWRRVRQAVKKPWPIELAEIDIGFLEIEMGSVPPRRKLMSRWGLTERKTRSILERFKLNRPAPDASASQIVTVEDAQAPVITDSLVLIASQPVTASVPKRAERFVVEIRTVFDTWELAQYRRTHRHNKLTKGRERVLRAALTGGHTAQDLILVVRMAFEFPDGDFLVDSWRQQGYMDIANLLNREKVDRNVTVARERWDGNEWIFIPSKKQSFEPKYEALWESLLFLVGAYPSRPTSLHSIRKVHEAMVEAVDSVGGWRFLGTLRPGKQQHVVRDQFLSEVRTELQSNTQNKIISRGNHR